jgi:hypothetical protein
MSCFLCNHAIVATEACGALEFAGDALAERGRYAVHRECLRPEWKKRFVTREQLLHPEMLSLVSAQVDAEQAKWAREAKEAWYTSPSPLRRLLAQFFAWGSKQFAVEPEQLHFTRMASEARLRAQETICRCAWPGCTQSRGATGFCTQHQVRGEFIAEPAPEPQRPDVSTLTVTECVEAMHKHARCCAYGEHFHCEEFIALGRQYLDMGGLLSDLGPPWDVWNIDDNVASHNDAFYVISPVVPIRRPE